jgi:hypothetical protein
MISQVAFKTDEVLKKSALQKAKREGVTLKAVLTYFLKSYVAGDIELGVVHRDANGFTKDAKVDFLRSLNDPKNKVTGSFESKEELLAHLDSLSK